MQGEGLPGAAWRKSSYSGNGQSCVEMAPVGGEVATRDSKNPAGPVLYFKPHRWASFLRTLEDGTLDPR